MAGRRNRCVPLALLTLLAFLGVPAFVGGRVSWKPTMKPPSKANPKQDVVWPWKIVPRLLLELRVLRQKIWIRCSRASDVITGLFLTFSVSPQCAIFFHPWQWMSWDVVEEDQRHHLWGRVWKEGWGICGGSGSWRFESYVPHIWVSSIYLLYFAHFFWQVRTYVTQCGQISMVIWHFLVNVSLSHWQSWFGAGFPDPVRLGGHCAVGWWLFVLFSRATVHGWWWRNPGCSIVWDWQWLITLGYTCPKVWPSMWKTDTFDYWNMYFFKS